MGDCEIFQETTVKIEEEVKVEQDDCSDGVEETGLWDLAVKEEQIYSNNENHEDTDQCNLEQLEAFVCELPVKEHRDSEEEELKPPVAVWVNEEPVEHAQEVEDPLALADEAPVDIPHPQGEASPEQERATQSSPKITTGCRRACSLCGKHFSRDAHFALHMLTHKGETSKECSACGKIFFKRRFPVRHLCTYIEEKTQMCPLCRKRFTRRLHLVQHMRSHAEEKSHGCFVCGERFTQKGIA